MAATGGLNLLFLEKIDHLGGLFFLYAIVIFFLNMIVSMHKPRTDTVVRGPGTGESMAVRDSNQEREVIPLFLSFQAEYHVRRSYCTAWAWVNARLP